jgi:cytoskeletal protein CcmA (bactofilin family)
MTSDPGIPITFVDGKEVPPLFIDEDHTIVGSHLGATVVRQGTLLVLGEVSGSIHLRSGTQVVVRGQVSGSISIATGAEARIVGGHSGSVTVAPGGRLVIDRTGRQAGSISNDGSVIIRGEFGGSTSGAGEFSIEPGARIKQPRVVDGVSYYDW